MGGSGFTSQLRETGIQSEKWPSWSERSMRRTLDIQFVEDRRLWLQPEPWPVFLMAAFLFWVCRHFILFSLEGDGMFAKKLLKWTLGRAGPGRARLESGRAGLLQLAGPRPKLAQRGGTSSSVRPGGVELRSASSVSPSPTSSVAPGDELIWSQCFKKPLPGFKMSSFVCSNNEKLVVLTGFHKPWASADDATLIHGLILKYKRELFSLKSGTCEVGLSVPWAMVRRSYFLCPVLLDEHDVLYPLYTVYPPPHCDEDQHKALEWWIRPSAREKNPFLKKQTNK